MYRGYVKIWRKLEDWEWYSYPNMTFFLIHLLLLVSLPSYRPTLSTNNQWGMSPLIEVSLYPALTGSKTPTLRREIN